MRTDPANGGAHAPDRLPLVMRWWRAAGNALVVLWGVGFVALPLGTAMLRGEAPELRSIGLGASFGVMMIVAAWIAVLVAIGLWLVLLRFAPALDRSRIAMPVFAIVIVGLGLREHLASPPIAIMATLGVIAFALPRWLVKSLSRGSLSPR